VSRKTVSFSMPATGLGASEKRERRAPTTAIDAHSDDWVSDRHGPASESRPRPAPPSLILDLAAERGLVEVFALSMIAPFALGFFWLINAMTGRVRI
jgi:hypothetical protein